jgi:hypothetical protein
MQLRRFLSYRTFAFVIAAIFFALTSWENAANQLCCADDSGFAVVAKNVATGVGYAYSLNYHGPDFAVRTFDPWIGGGPVLIFGAALLIKIFGVKAWVPGLATVILCSSMIFLLGLQLRVLFGARKAAFVLVGFVSLVLSISLYDFHYWSALLGEGAASLAIVLGYLYWASSEKWLGYSFLSGIFMSAAFLIKEVSAIHIMALFVFILISSFWSEVRFFSIKNIAALLMGLALPFAAFELYRLCVLGSLGAYATNWLDHIAFVHEQGANDHPLGLADYWARVSSFMDRYDLQAGVLFIGILLIFTNVILSDAGVRSVMFRLTLMITIGMIMHSAYWIFLSIGWVRYAFYVAVLFCLLIAMCCEWRTIVGFSGVALCLYLWVYCWPRLTYVLDQSRAGMRGDPVEMVSARQVLGFIQENGVETPIYTGWWADVAALEYLAPKQKMFMGYQVALQAKAWPITVLTDDRFPVDNADFKELLGKCHAVLIKAPYTLYDCGH